MPNLSLEFRKRLFMFAFFCVTPVAVNGGGGGQGGGDGGGQGGSMEMASGQGGGGGGSNQAPQQNQNQQQQQNQDGQHNHQQQPSPPSDTVSIVTPSQPAPLVKSAPKRLKNVFATIEVEYDGQPMGTIRAKLFIDKMPNTVTNFMGLAEGEKAFKEFDEKKGKVGEMVTRRFYDGLTFHRVVPGFVIQGGCPYGKGTGGPGYTIPDETHRELRHDSAGMLSMVRTSQKNSGGSQFFVTLGPAPSLDGTYALFGKVIEGMDVVAKMGKVHLARGTEKPDKPLVMKSVKISKEYFN